MKSIIYPSRIKNSNLGDILINVLLVRELSKHAIVYLDGNNESLEKYARVHNDNADNIRVVGGLSALQGYPVFRWFNLLGIMGSVAYVFDPPGHYSQGKNRLKYVLKTVKYATRATVLKLFNIKCVRMGATVGPYDKLAWKFQKPVFRSFHEIAVRDKNNYQAIFDLKFPNVSFIDDLAFLFDPSVFKVKSNNATNKNTIVLSFRTSMEGAHHDKAYFEGVLNSLPKLLQKIAGFKDKKYIITYQVEEDKHAIPALREVMLNHSLTYGVGEEQLSFHEAISLYASADYVVTNRLHVALLAMLNNAKTIILTDTAQHYKLCNLMKDWKLESIMVDSREPSQSFQAEAIGEAMDVFKILALNKRNSIDNRILSLFSTTN